MKKRFYLLCIGSALILTSCGGSATPMGMITNSGYEGDAYISESVMWNDYDYDYGTSSYKEASTVVSGSGVRNSSQTTMEQKLIRRVRIDLELDSNIDLESNAVKIQQLATSAGGYTADISLDNRSSWANGNLTIKVPKDNVDGFLTNVKELGIKVNSISDSSEDVTMQYVDVATRLEVQQTALRKYKQYLEQANSVDELLSIETKIDNIVAEMESYQAKLRVMDNQIDYTEITVSINCKTSINRDSFWVRAGQRLKTVGYEIGDTILDAFEWMMNSVIVILFAAVPGILIIRIVMFAFRWKRRFHPIQWIRGKFRKKDKDVDAE